MGFRFAAAQENCHVLFIIYEIDNWHSILTCHSKYLNYFKLRLWPCSCKVLYTFATNCLEPVNNYLIYGMLKLILMCTCIGLKKGEDVWGIDVVLMIGLRIMSACFWSVHRLKSWRTVNLGNTVWPGNTMTEWSSLTNLTLWVTSSSVS